MKKNKSILLKLLLVFIFVLLISVFYFIWDKKYRTSAAPNVKWPFKNLKDENGKNINVIAITAPFRSDKDKDIYLDYKKQGISIIGITSYLEFPGTIDNKYEDTYYKNHDDNYLAMSIGWCHCFRNPDKYISDSSIPKILLSESDYTECEGSHFTPLNKEYDFIYSCPPEVDKSEEGWQSTIRNWKLMKKCLPILCGKFNLKGVIVGRKKPDFFYGIDNILFIEKFIPYVEFIKYMNKCKFIIVPNLSDASPRVASEAMCRDLRVLMNSNIVGGWKYVNEFTGEFFTSEQDIETSLLKMLNRWALYTPRKWYRENYGKRNTGLKMKKFLKEIKPNLSPCEIVTIKI